MRWEMYRVHACGATVVAMVYQRNCETSVSLNHVESTSPVITTCPVEVGFAKCDVTKFGFGAKMRHKATQPKDSIRPPALQNLAANCSGRPRMQCSSW